MASDRLRLVHSVRAPLLTLGALATFMVLAPSPPSTAAPASPSAPAPGPSPTAELACPAPEARAFDFWHGEWSVNNRYLTEQGWQDAGRADVRVYPALSGCLTVEHWVGDLGPNRLLGFSARAWDANTGRWVLLLNWPSPRQATFGTLEGTFRHGRGEFFSEGTNPEGKATVTRFSFADIGADSFRWDQAFAPAPEGPWRTTWIMEYSRRDPLGEPPIFVEPATDVSRCDAPAYREFDFLLGDWQATTDIPRRDGTTHHQEASMRAVPILGDCAVMDFWTTHGEAPEFQALRIRAYDEAQGVWVQYWYDTVERIFQRFEGGRQPNGDLVLTYEVDERRDRITWATTAEEGPRWRYEMSFDGGASWRLHAAAALRR